jgi:hypothetical protein
MRLVIKIESEEGKLLEQRDYDAQSWLNHTRWTQDVYMQGINDMIIQAKKRVNSDG